MAVTVSLINMKGGVGKTTLAFNLSWHCAFHSDLKVLAIDLDPQSNFSQYLMGAEDYLKYLKFNRSTIVDIFERFYTVQDKQAFPPSSFASEVICTISEWDDGSLLHLIPSRLELAHVLKKPTNKEKILSQFLEKISSSYDLIIIDCAPTESILTTAAYQASDYVFVPVKPEFLAGIGLPLVARSLKEFREMNSDKIIEMGGIIFNGRRRANESPEQWKTDKEVRSIAMQHNWYIFQNEIFFSDSYPAGSRDGYPIFDTKHARDYVKDEFSYVAGEFLKKIGFKLDE